MRKGSPRTVEDIEGPWLGTDPRFESGLIQRCRQSGSTPIDQLSNEMLATYLRQRIALKLIAPEAERRIDAGFEDGSEMYDGKLAAALPRIADSPNGPVSLA